MLDKSLRSNVSRVISGGLAKFLIEPQSSNWFNSVKVLNRFLDGGWSLLSSQGGLTWLLQKISFESTKPFLKVRDKRSGVRPELILQFENLLVQVADISW